MRRIRKVVLTIVMASILFVCNVPLHVKAATTPETVDDAYVLSRLGQLAGLLGINEGNLDEGDGVYFTVNQQACGTGLGGHSCDNCKNTNVTNAEWFKTLFGTIYTGGFPQQYKEDGSVGGSIGWSCWGFANFAMWYVASTQNTDEIVGTLVTTSTFTKENILSLLEPGDIIRSNGHSMVFISADENAMKVMDSNWRTAGDATNCRVRIREFGYSDSEFTYFKGKAMSITRAKNYDPDSAGIIPPITSEQEELVRAFIERMYTVALGRASDTPGTEYWTAELLSRRMDGAGISAGFIMSEEFATKNYGNEEYLKVLYGTFFNREADEGGMNFWLEELDAGRSRKSVLAGFVNSVEFTAICESYGIDRGNMADDATATGAGQFVERLYTIALERPSDPAGLEDWAKSINEKTNTPEQVAKEFFLSSEYAAKNTTNDKYVETLYLVFLGRASDAEGKAFWVELLNGGMSREAVLEGFAQSQEFKELMARYGL